VLASKPDTLLDLKALAIRIDSRLYECRQEQKLPFGSSNSRFCTQHPGKAPFLVSIDSSG
jgi:hypothetical protein